MKILFFNVGYFSGANSYKRYFTLFWRYFLPDKKIFARFINFIKAVNPDVLALVELNKKVPSWNGIDLVSVVKKEFGFRSVAFRNKYGESFNTKPFYRRAFNAIFYKGDFTDFDFYYFSKGYKKLVIHTKLDNGFNLIIVHLSLGKNVRAKQLKELTRLAKKHREKLVVFGDFNIYRGLPEIENLIKDCNLVNVNNKHLKTLPSNRPTKELDLFLVSKDVKVKNFEILESDISDHLPILLEVGVS